MGKQCVCITPPPLPRVCAHAVRQHVYESVRVRLYVHACVRMCVFVPAVCVCVCVSVCVCVCVSEEVSEKERGGGLFL